MTTVKTSPNPSAKSKKSKSVVNKINKKAKNTSSKKLKPKKKAITSSKLNPETLDTSPKDLEIAADELLLANGEDLQDNSKLENPNP